MTFLNFILEILDCIGEFFFSSADAQGTGDDYSDTRNKKRSRKRNRRNKMTTPG